MAFMVKTKKDMLQGVVAFEIILIGIVLLKPELTGGNDIAWLTGGQLLVLTLLFMPETRHGVGDRPSKSEYEESKRKWAHMSESDKKRVTAEAWHDSTLWTIYTACIVLSLWFVAAIWVPFIYPEISKLFV